jgi:hypothetical protein
LENVAEIFVLFLCGVQLVLTSGVLTKLDLDEVDVAPRFACFLERLIVACLSALVLWLPSPRFCGLLIVLLHASQARLLLLVCQASCGLQACLFVAYYCLMITVDYLGLPVCFLIGSLLQ